MYLQVFSTTVGMLEWSCNSRGRIRLSSFVVCTAAVSNECWLNGFKHASMTMDVSQFLEYNLEEFGH